MMIVQQIHNYTNLKEVHIQRKFIVFVTNT